MDKQSDMQVENLNMGEFLEAFIASFRTLFYSELGC